MAAGDDESKRNPKAKKGKKKSKKDKWGQPVEDAGEDVPPPAGEEDVGEAVLHEGGGRGGEGEYEPRKVVASGMPYSATEDDIREVFAAAGTVVQLQLSRFPDSGNFRGLAFITFKTKENAIEALKLDGQAMGNRFIKVERCRSDPERKRKREFLGDPEKVEGCHTAYIGNLSFDVTEDDLRALFDASRIASIRFAVNKKTGQFRGFGHIDFEDDESLELAIGKNQSELHGRPIKVAYAVSNRA